MNLQQKKDNSFLATEPLGKLLLKLSLPTVTAQIINMLYNIVDRIYIGHIPENGALALTGVGVHAPHHDCFRFRGPCRKRRRSQSLYFYGKRR